MAQISSAAREPSMEEILASIRRIIEDSDVVRQGSPVADPAPHDKRNKITSFRRTEIQPTADPLADVAKPDAQQSEPSVEPSVIPVVKPAPALFNMRDILDDKVNLRGLIDDVSYVNAPAASFEESVEDNADDIVLNANNDDYAKLTGLAEPKTPILDHLEQSVEDDITQAIADMLAEEAPTENVETLTKPLVSDATGRQVAASFGDLSGVLRAEQRRTLDATAEALLRPMLQDWLDNNLPTLVERLVREEIERVVRGDHA